MTHVIV